MLDLSVIGQKFGRLKIIEFLEKRHTTGQILCRCVCDCGKEKIAVKRNLITGHTKSCGCMKFTSSKLSHKRPYSVWRSMMKRCYRPTNDNYESYGGKGIVVCDNWKNFNGFWKDMASGYSDFLTIDRIDNNKNYEKDNCRWSTPKQQANNRTSSRLFTLDGVTMNVSQWCESLGVDRKVVFARLWRGWEFERALKLPLIR